MINITFDTSEIDATIDRLINLPIEGFQKDVGEYVQGQIRKRLAAGVDVDEEPFIPLGSGYARQKREAGFGGLPVMTATHQMEESLFPEFDGDEVFVTVHGTHRVIPNLVDEERSMELVAENLEEGALTSGPRKFLGLNEMDENWILDRLAKMFLPDLT